MEFTGANISQVDASGRITLRENHLDQIEGKLILTQGFDNQVLAFTEAQWNEFLKLLVPRGDGFDPDGDDLRLLFVGNATEVEIDDRGRLKIPEHLRETAGLQPGTSRARVLWVGTRFEIWDERAYAKFAQRRAAELKQKFAAQREQVRTVGEVEAGQP